MEHDLHFPVRQRQLIQILSRFLLEFVVLHLQVSARQKQAPDGVLICVQLIKNNLFIDFFTQTPAFQQILHGYFYVCTSLPDQLIHQAIAAGVGPVGGKPPRFQIIYDGPGVVDIPAFSKSKTIIPFFNINTLIRHPIFIQCSKYLFFCKPKAILIHLRG